MKIKTITAIFLLGFSLAYVTIVMFGKLQASMLFNTIFFIMVVSALGIIYYSQRAKLTGTLQHLAMILALLIVSATLASAAGLLKDSYDRNSSILSTKQALEQDLSAIESQNVYYAQTVDYMTNQTAAFKRDNQALQRRIDDLNRAIAAKNQQALDSTVSQLQAQYEEQQKQLEDEILVLQSQIEQLQSTIRSQQSTIRVLEDRLAQQRQEVSDE